MNLPFDTTRLINPKTPEDFMALLDEALLEMENLNEHMTALSEHLELMSRLTGGSK